MSTGNLVDCLQALKATLRFILWRAIEPLSAKELAIVHVWIWGLESCFRLISSLRCTLLSTYHRNRMLQSRFWILKWTFLLLGMTELAGLLNSEPVNFQGQPSAGPQGP
jgi:hypothetical protein